MRRLLYILYIMPMLLLAAPAARAQIVPANDDIPKNDPALKFGFQSVIEAEMSVLPELKVKAGTELRVQGDFLYKRQLRFNAGAEYKLAKRFWFLGEYTLIRKFNNGGKVSYRHRTTIGLKETVKFNKKSKLSFSEKLEWSHRTGDFNEYQNTRDAFDVKLKAKYSFSFNKKIGVFASGEARVSFSEPKLNDIYYDPELMQFTDAAGFSKGEEGWFLNGFKRIALNRLRGNLGFNFSFNRHHKVELSALLDYNKNLEIDANKKGTVIKSLVIDRSFTLFGKLAYSFSF